MLDGYRSNIIDGLILSPLSVTPADLTDRGLDFPTVLLGESVNTGGFLHISIDNVAAARLATEHLLGLGHRRIAAVGSMPDRDILGPAARRMRGFTDAISAAGLPLDLIFPAAPWTRMSGYRVASDMIRDGTDDDAMFCLNDLLALGRRRPCGTTASGYPTTSR